MIQFFIGNKFILAQINGGPNLLVRQTFNTELSIMPHIKSHVSQVHQFLISGRRFISALQPRVSWRLYDCCPSLITVKYVTMMSNEQS